MEPRNDSFCSGLGKASRAADAMRYPPSAPPEQPRRPCLHFPPPPPYPPPDQSPERYPDGIPISAVVPPSPGEPLVPAAAASMLSTQDVPPDDDRMERVGYQVSSEPRRKDKNEYSYAYYEPGLPTHFASSVTNNPCLNDRASRHTYTTRYGTEENIYEEISEVAARWPHPPPQAMPPSCQSSTAGLQEEVRRVQWRHHRVLGELNLAVEAMLMPAARDEGESPATPPGPPDLLEDLLMHVSPTDELLSPSAAAADKSFTLGQRLPEHDVSFGASSSASLPGHAHKAVPPPLERRSRSSSSLWSRCAWKRIPGLGSGRSSGKHESRPHAGSCTDGCDENPPGRRGSGEVEPGPYQIEPEESWGLGSDQELSGDENDQSSASVTKNNGQLRSTLNKARTLCDKWRGGKPAETSGILPVEVAGNTGCPQGRLSRWFSIRRGSSHHYDVDVTLDRSSSSGKMPLLPEVEEENGSNFGNFSCIFQRRQLPPSLPTPPSGLTPEQLKRRHIVAAIVHSENSYVATLQRLVNDYKKPLEESSPPILSASKISTLFLRLPEILQCHTLFRIALAECVRNWDRDEKIGDVFVASFSKAIVLEIYSDFINNFSVAMDLAKMEAKRKSALADFLKVKQISAHDRLSFFGLMVKPVQRFPQFILFLQDLLKHTPHGHHDRMSLQLALTQLESLAEMLNERKREAEQLQACKEMLRHISGKFAARPRSDIQRYLLREDDVTQLEFNQQGLITKSKSRRLLLLNDLVVCVSVAPKPNDDFSSVERLSLKWTNPVSDIEVVDTSASPTLSRLLTANSSRSSSLKSDRNTGSFDSSVSSTAGADNICVEMNNLMHDYEVVSRIAELVSTLRGTYKDLTVESTRRILNSIQSSIQQKDEEMAWADSCCLQIAVHGRSNKEEIYTFQTSSPSVKKEWITELRLAQLALDPNNSPAWEVPEQERRPSTKMPLFVKAQAVYRSQHQTEVQCGCYYTINSSRMSRRRNRTNSYLWVCTTDGASSHIAILTQPLQQQAQLRDVASFDLVETKVSAMEFVRGTVSKGNGLCSDTVWMGTDSRRILIYAASDPEHHQEVGSCIVSASIVHIRSHCDCVFVALADGSLLLYHRQNDGAWSLDKPLSNTLGSEPVSSLLPINNCLYAACGKKVWVLDAITGEIQKNFSVQHEHLGSVNLMAHSGIGLWISLKNSSTICLYHTETFKHLQDINIASNVLRVTSSSNGSGSSKGSLNNCTNRDCINNSTVVTVTSLMACKGLLWVGTNVGISLTIPLPRLEGVPIISGRVNISYHAHFGPIHFLLALQPRSTYSSYSWKDQEEGDSKEVIKDVDTTISSTDSNEISNIKEEKKLTDNAAHKSMTAKLKQHLTSSPVVLRKRTSKESDLMNRRMSKTLPRGLGCGIGLLSTSTTSSQGSSDTCDVYGLYGELMYVKDYDGEENALTGGADPIYESLHRSDPELAAIPGKVSTLDRRLKLKVSRPRSLDLSNWSVDSKSSVYTSSGSEETLSRRNSSRRVSRHGSSVSASADPQCANECVDLIPGTRESNQKQKEKTVPIPPPTDTSRRTVITLMGGRGYVNWRHACCTDENKSSKNSNPFGFDVPNCNDAHIVIWEMKL